MGPLQTLFGRCLGAPKTNAAGVVKGSIHRQCQQGLPGTGSDSLAPVDTDQCLKFVGANEDNQQRRADVVFNTEYNGTLAVDSGESWVSLFENSAEDPVVLLEYVGITEADSDDHINFNPGSLLLDINLRALLQQACGIAAFTPEQADLHASYSHCTSVRLSARFANAALRSYLRCPTPHHYEELLARVLSSDPLLLTTLKDTCIALLEGALSGCPIAPPGADPNGGRAHPLVVQHPIAGSSSRMLLPLTLHPLLVRRPGGPSDPRPDRVAPPATASAGAGAAFRLTGNGAQPYDHNHLQQDHSRGGGTAAIRNGRQAPAAVVVAAVALRYRLSASTSSSSGMAVMHEQLGRCLSALAHLPSGVTLLSGDGWRVLYQNAASVAYMGLRQGCVAEGAPVDRSGNGGSAHGNATGRSGGAAEQDHGDASGAGGGSRAWGSSRSCVGLRSGGTGWGAAGIAIGGAAAAATGADGAADAPAALTVAPAAVQGGLLRELFALSPQQGLEVVREVTAGRGWKGIVRVPHLLTRHPAAALARAERNQGPGSRSSSARLGLGLVRVASGSPQPGDAGSGRLSDAAADDGTSTQGGREEGRYTERPYTPRHELPVLHCGVVEWQQLNLMVAHQQHQQHQQQPSGQTCLPLRPAQNLTNNGPHPDTPRINNSDALAVATVDGAAVETPAPGGGGDRGAGDGGTTTNTQLSDGTAATGDAPTFGAQGWLAAVSSLLLQRALGSLSARRSPSAAPPSSVRHGPGAASGVGAASADGRACSGVAGLAAEGGCCGSLGTAGGSDAELYKTPAVGAWAAGGSGSAAAQSGPSVLAAGAPPTLYSVLTAAATMAAVRQSNISAASSELHLPPVQEGVSMPLSNIGLGVLNELYGCGPRSSLAMYGNGIGDAHAPIAAGPVANGGGEHGRSSVPSVHSGHSACSIARAGARRSTGHGSLPSNTITDGEFDADGAAAARRCNAGGGAWSASFSVRPAAAREGGDSGGGGGAHLFVSGLRQGSMFGVLGGGAGTPAAAAAAAARVATGTATGFRGGLVSADGAGHAGGGGGVGGFEVNPGRPRLMDAYSSVPSRSLKVSYRRYGGADDGRDCATTTAQRSSGNGGAGITSWGSFNGRSGGGLSHAARQSIELRRTALGFGRQQPGGSWENPLSTSTWGLLAGAGGGEAEQIKRNTSFGAHVLRATSSHYHSHNHNHHGNPGPGGGSGSWHAAVPPPSNSPPAIASGATSSSRNSPGAVASGPCGPRSGNGMLLPSAGPVPAGIASARESRDGGSWGMAPTASRPAAVALPPPTQEYQQQQQQQQTRTRSGAPGISNGGYSHDSGGGGSGETHPGMTAATDGGSGGRGDQAGRPHKIRLGGPSILGNSLACRPAATASSDASGALDAQRCRNGSWKNGGDGGGGDGDGSQSTATATPAVELVLADEVRSGDRVPGRGTAQRGRGPMAPSGPEGLQQAAAPDGPAVPSTTTTTTAAPSGPAAAPVTATMLESSAAIWDWGDCLEGDGVQGGGDWPEPDGDAAARRRQHADRGGASGEGSAAGSKGRQQAEGGGKDRLSGLEQQGAEEGRREAGRGPAYPAVTSEGMSWAGRSNAGAAAEGAAGAAESAAEAGPVATRLVVRGSSAAAGAAAACTSAGAPAAAPAPTATATRGVSLRGEAGEEGDEEGACWHEVTVTPLTTHGSRMLLIMQADVTARVLAERRIARVLEAEHQLLESIFPRHVLEHAADTAFKGAAQQGAAARFSLTRLPLAQNSASIATYHPMVTILFADIKGFTNLCHQIPATAVMRFLNDLYSRLDTLLDVYGVYKVETIGDCYMVAGGLMTRDADGFMTVRGADSVDELHAAKTMAFAKAMLREAARVTLPTTGEAVEMRIGLHSGAVMSGIVGSKMPRFCLFGDTVNTASRMESTCPPGCIHVSATTRALLVDEEWEPTGGVEVKGIGTMDTYHWRDRDGDDCRSSHCLASRAVAAAGAAAAAPLSCRLHGSGGGTGVADRRGAATGSRLRESRHRRASTVVLMSSTEAHSVQVMAATAAAAAATGATAGAAVTAGGLVCFDEGGNGASDCPADTEITADVATAAAAAHKCTAGEMVRQGSSLGVGGRGGRSQMTPGSPQLPAPLPAARPPGEPQRQPPLPLPPPPPQPRPGKPHKGSPLRSARLKIKRSSTVLAIKGLEGGDVDIRELRRELSELMRTARERPREPQRGPQQQQQQEEQEEGPTELVETRGSVAGNSAGLPGDVFGLGI